MRVAFDRFVQRYARISGGGQLWYDIMLGVDDRKSGTTLCQKLRRQSGRCMVLRN